jgi:hypothetical protein
MLTKLLFSGLFTAALVLAQGGMGGQSGGGMGDMSGGGGTGRNSRGGDTGGDMGGGMPRAAQPTPMERMTTTFTLNKDQKKQVKTIMDDAQKEATPVKDQILKGRETIAQGVAAGKSQDDLNAAISELAASQTKMTQIEMGAFLKIYQALDKDQQAKAGALPAMMNGIFKNKNWDSNPTQ